MNPHGAVSLGRVAARDAMSLWSSALPLAGRLEIGAGTIINKPASIEARRLVSIGEDVRIGDFVAICDLDHDPIDAIMPVRMAPVKIGDNAWIGASGLVLPRVTNRAHAVVTAGLVVTTHERTLVPDNPARWLRKVTATDGWNRP